MRNYRVKLLSIILILLSSIIYADQQKINNHSVSKKTFTNWWFEPILYPKGELSLLGGSSASTQENYMKFMEIVAREWIEPGTIIIANKWCKFYGDPYPDQQKWPDMQKFISTYQHRGQRVLLSLKLWDTEGVPQEECLIKNGKCLAVNPFNPLYEKRLRNALRKILSSEKQSLNADGLMLNNIHQYRNFGNIQMAEKLLDIIRTEVKKIKPQALIIGDTTDPLLAKKVDMLNIKISVDSNENLEEKIDSKVERIGKTCPNYFVTWGIFPVSGREDWNRLLQIQLHASEKGCKKIRQYDPGVIVPHPTVVPIFYYVTRVGKDKKDILTWKDYHILRKIRSNYRWKFMYSHPITIRKIKQKIESWSALAPGQIIAQPFIQPIVSSGGYDTRGVKRAIVWLNNEEMKGTFEIIDVTRNLQDPTRQAVCYKGELKYWGRHKWGGNILVADFTEFQQPGFYLLRLHLDKTIEVVDSSAFVIEDNFYIKRAAQAGHFYYYQRCGTEIPGWHKACHLTDGILPNGEHKDFTGGWHDGGDYCKWSHYAYHGVIPLLELADLEKELNWKDPSPLPSPVDEADWECKYLLKVILPNGYLLSLVAPGPNPWVCLGAPENEFTRIARVENNLESPRVTAMTACALARTALHLSDSTQKQKYVDEAIRLYKLTTNWGPQDSKYEIFKNDYLEIQSALLLADCFFIKFGINTQQYEKDAIHRVKIILAQQDKKGVFYIDKEKTSKRIFTNYTMISLWYFLQTSIGKQWKNEITTAFLRWSNFIEPLLKVSPFGGIGRFDFKEEKIYCGPLNNRIIAQTGWTLATTAILTRNPKYLQYAQYQTLWILGLNPTSLSMMMGQGNNPKCIHHRYASISPGGHQILPGGILNGICFATHGKPLQIGDLNTQNYVIGDNLPTDYPVLDDDVFGWTWGYASNEYWSLNNGYFIMMTCQIARAQEKIK